MNFNFLSWLVVDQLQHLGLRKAEGLDSIDEASNAFGRRLLTLRRVDVLHHLRSRAQQTLRLRSIEWAKMRLILDVLRSRIDPLASGSPNAAPILFQDTPDLHVRKQRRGVVDAATHCVNTAPARMRAAFATYTIINRLVKTAVTGLLTVLNRGLRGLLEGLLNASLLCTCVYMYTCISTPNGAHW
jgi:hypothetical protein